MGCIWNLGRNVVLMCYTTKTTTLPVQSADELGFEHNCGVTTRRGSAVRSVKLTGNRKYALLSTITLQNQYIFIKFISIMHKTNFKQRYYVC